jgi:class 3 adenylate cyclase
MHGINHILNISECYDNSRLIRYLTKKGSNVDSCMKWKSVQDHRLDNYDEPHRKRQFDVEADQRCGKLRRCSRMMNFTSFAEMLHMAQKSEEDISVSAIKSCEDHPPQILSVGHTATGEEKCFRWPKRMDNYVPNSSIEEPLSLLSSSTNSERLRSSLAPSFGSLTSTSSLSKSRSFHLSTHTAAEVTVLQIDILGFTAECAALPAGRVGEWIAAFYSRVEKVGAIHGVQKVAVRGDCCICVAGLEGAIPSASSRAKNAPDQRSDQATRILAFAAELNSSLTSLNAGGRDGATTTRMGVATGEVSFIHSSVAGLDSTPFASVHGTAIDIAAQLEARATPGKVYVHRSTADKWAAETRRPPPPSAVMECSGGVRQRAAVYDCAARAFVDRQAGSSAPSPNQSSKGALRQRSSALF